MNGYIITNDQLEIARIGLGLGLVLSNIAVWYGVYLEHDRFPKETQDKGWRILLVGLAVEAVLAFILLATDTTIGLRQRREIFTLEAQLAPRFITKEQQATFVELLRPFHDTVATVWRFQTASSDTASFAIVITGLLQAANWAARGVSTSFGSEYVKGVIVLKRSGAAPAITSAAAALIDALNSVQITAFPAPDFSGNGGDVFANGMIVAGPNADIIVFVGDKP